MGFRILLSYAFSKHIDENVSPTPFAPAGYDRGRSTFDRTHILAFMRSMNSRSAKVENFEFSPSGREQDHRWVAICRGSITLPRGRLDFSVSGVILGNGRNTRRNVSGEIEDISNSDANGWFNTAASPCRPTSLSGLRDSGSLMDRGTRAGHESH